MLCLLFSFIRSVLLNFGIPSVEELNTSQGGATFVESVFKTVNNRSILDFISEVYIVQMV